jgi:two-component sensor histidine kinase
MKNVLTMAQVLAQQTFRSLPAAAEPIRMFQQRIAALARASGLLRADRWQSAEMQDIAQNVSEPLGPALAARLKVAGPAVALTPQIAMLVSLVLHELATNAVKYGALSNDSGIVDLRWRLAEGVYPPRLQIEWIERGGPPVAPADRKGFGTSLIQRSFTEQSGGRAQGSFCRKACAARWNVRRQRMAED